jgi:hypothetical protein
MQLATGGLLGLILAVFINLWTRRQQPVRNAPGPTP